MPAHTHMHMYTREKKKGKKKKKKPTNPTVTSKGKIYPISTTIKGGKKKALYQCYKHKIAPSKTHTHICI